MSFEKIHITELHEYLAAAVLKYSKPLEAAVREMGQDGFLKIEIKESEDHFSSDAVDFELQVCECPGLGEEAEINDYIGRTINTSSVYEFVDFLSGGPDSFSMLINIEEGMWKIKLLTAEY